VPEFEQHRTTIPPFTPAPRPVGLSSSTEDPFAGLGVESQAPQREGLPSSYRMRNDHLVDQLTTRLALPQIRAIPVADITGARPHDPRTIEPLVQSIAKLGILQPLLVRARSGRFELIAGARRLSAAAVAGLAEVPCLVYTCDDQRARVVAEAENVRGLPEAEAAGTADNGVPASGLEELQHSFGTIESCLHLLVDRDASLRDRVALDLVRTEAHRARRLVQCLSVLAVDPALSLTALPLRSLADEALDALGPERRLSGVQVNVESGGGLHDVTVDPLWFGVAITGMIGGLIALVQNTRTPSLEVRLSTAGPGAPATLELSQQGVTVPAWALPRFFDPRWTDRPGGYQAAVELAAARRIVDLHRGGLELSAGERGGCRLVLTLPGSR
jgi:ParB-like chromosome segregation protein Spo0J